MAASAASPMMATAWKPSPGPATGWGAISPRVEIKPFSMPPASRRPIGTIASSPDKPRTRASSKAIKVKSLSLVNPMPVLKAKLQQVVANKVTTKATAVDAKFKRKAQSLCDSVAVLVKARDAVEFESLLEDFDIYKKISMPRKLESRLMQVIWVIARGKVSISLEDFSATPRKKK